MFDVALSRAGAHISMATSSDDEYPPENMLDGKTETFWTTTGMFPQSFIVSFQSEMTLKSIQMFCSNVKKLVIHKCSQQEPIDFDLVTEKEMDCVEGQMQSEEISLTRTEARHLKFVILTAHDHFVSVHKLQIDGEAVRG